MESHPLLFHVVKIPYYYINLVLHALYKTMVGLDYRVYDLKCSILLLSMKYNA